MIEVPRHKYMKQFSFDLAKMLSWEFIFYLKKQRIMCCKKFAENQQSKWNIILSHHLKSVRWGLILRCAFDLKKFCFKLPIYYEECFRCFAEYSVAKQNERCSKRYTIQKFGIVLNYILMVITYVPIKLSILKNIYREVLSKKSRLYQPHN